MIYRQGAEEVRWLESKGQRAGTMVQRADRSQRVPAGRVHAVDDDGQVVCGYDGHLYILGNEWRTGLGLDRCPECREAVPIYGT